MQNLTAKSDQIWVILIFSNSKKIDRLDFLI